MGTPDFEELLKRTMGMDSSSIGSSVIRRAVLQRSAICQLPDLEEYWRLVCDSKAELQELIEAVVVPETWFFRDRKAFTALGQIASDQWWPAHPEGVMRLLSLPCSTGEEPFSMAMALQEAGLPLNRFCIDAFDISGHALARARRAIYGKNSFRGDDLAFRERFFEPHEGGHRLCDTVRGQVRFQQGNLLHPDFLAGSERYDVIFCRNVLIYFDRPTQERAITLLTRLLSSEGVVFVGPSESGLLLSQKYVSAKIPLAFAFYKQPREAKAAVRLPSAPGVKRPAPVAVIRPPLPPLPPIRPVATAAAAPSKEPAEPLEEAGRLADQGRLSEAATLCRTHIQRHGPSTKVYYLLGLIHDAAGEPSEAVADYRKALYLDPSHRESLLHLAFLLEKQGNKSGAQVLRKRAERI